MSTVTPSNPTTPSKAVTFFGPKGYNDQWPETCVLCQLTIEPFKAAKPVLRYDPAKRTPGQLLGNRPKTVAEEHERRHTVILGYSHGFHRWVNPALRPEWLENRIDIIDVSKDHVDKELERVYTVMAMNKADEVKAIRAQLGWTQQRLADYLGVRVTSVGRWEQGKANPRAVVMVALKLLRNQESVNAA